MNPKNNFINSLSNKISNFSVGVKKPVPQTPMQTSPYQVGVSAPRPGVTAPAKAIITSNPSATSANKTVIKAPTTNSTGTALSSAGKQFANTLSANDASNKYNTSTGELNTNFSGYTAPDNNKNTTASTQPAPQEDPYIKYLNSLFNPEQTTKALDTLNSANTRLADIQNRNEKQALDARVNYENTLDTPGGLKIGAEQAASVGNRRASAESAYGAIEEGAAARSAMVAKDTYDQYINAGKTVYEATQAANKAKLEADRYTQERTDKLNAPFDLSEGQSRYEINPTTRKYEQVASNGKTYAPGSTGSGTGTAGGITQAVMANPALYSTLTPTVKGQVIREMQAQGLDTTALTIPQLNNAQREQIDSFDTLQREAQLAKTYLESGLNTGPLASRTKKVGALLGGQKEFTQYRSSIDNLGSILIKARSGAAVTPQEFERIKGFIPGVNDDEATAKTKIDRFFSELEAAKANYIKRATQTSQQIASPTKTATSGVTSSGIKYTIEK